MYKGGRVSKKCASQRGGSGELEHGLPPYAPALPPPPSLNNDPALTHSTDWHCCPFRTHGKECCIMYVGNTLGLSQHANMVLMLKKRQQENPCRSPQRQWLRYTRSYSTQSGSATYISMFDSGEYCLFFFCL